MSAPYDGTWLTSQTLALLALSADLDAHRQQVADVVWEVGARYGDRGAFSMACSLAACIARMDGYQLGAQGFYGFVVTDTVTGEAISPDQLPGGQDVMAGMRFLTAWANEDTRACLDLFHAMPGEGFTGLCMLAGAAVRDGRAFASRDNPPT